MILPRRHRADTRATPAALTRGSALEAFNASHDDVQIVLEVVENDVAYDTLSTQIAGGNPPDIVGPVGRDGANSYAGLYLDLEPLIDETGYDTSRWPAETVENFREDDGSLPGLPFASFPSFIYFNTELVDEAGLPYPPQTYAEDGTAVYGEGTEYEGTWDYDKVAEIAEILTDDANGNDATSPELRSLPDRPVGLHQPVDDADVRPGHPRRGRQPRGDRQRRDGQLPPLVHVLHPR